MSSGDIIFVILMVILDIIIFGYIGNQIGWQRGRPDAGIVWSILLGPLGWLIVWLGPDLRPKCPACLGVIEKGATRCKNCGIELVDENAEADLALSSPKFPRVRRLKPKIHHPTPRIRSA